MLVCINTFCLMTPYLVESDEALLDRLRVVVHASARLAAEGQPRRHRGVGDVEVDDFVARLDGILEPATLIHFARVPVDEEALGALEGRLDHRVLDQLQDDGERHQLAALHRLVQLLADRRTGSNRVAKEIAWIVFGVGGSSLF